MFLNIFRRFPKIVKNFQKEPKISEEEPMMFRSYSNTSKYFLKGYVTKAVMIFALTKVTYYLEGIMLMHESSPGISVVFML